MIATYPLRWDIFQELYDRLTDDDVGEFNSAFGGTYTKSEVAYMTATITRLDDVLTGYYGREIPFRTKFLKVTWTARYVLVQVEVKRAGAQDQARRAAPGEADPAMAWIPALQGLAAESAQA